MRTSINYKKGTPVVRAWTLRLITGLGFAYLAAIGMLSAFRHLGGEPSLVIGFLCAFALMPGLLLMIFAVPSRHQNRTLHCLLALVIPCLGLLP